MKLFATGRVLRVFTRAVPLFVVANLFVAISAQATPHTKPMVSSKTTLEHQPDAVSKTKAEGFLALKPEAGYLLSLKSNGPETYTIQVTKSAMRVDLLNAKCTVVSFAPAWNVVAWKNLDHTIMHVTHDDWCHKYQQRKMSWPAELTKPVSVTSETFMNAPALKCIFPATEVAGLFMQSSVGKKNNKDNLNDNNFSEVMCLKAAGGKDSGFVFARFFGMPPVPGVPLVVRRIRANGVMEGTLHAKRITPATIQPAAFVIPKGYTDIPFDSSYFFSKIQNENARELFNSILH